MKRIGLDTGGTFTDCIVLDEDGGLRQYKVPTTPSALDEGVMTAIGKAADAHGETIAELLGTVNLLIHGTTQATNALLTGQGAVTGLLTTEGFRDVIEIRRGIKSITLHL